MSLRQHEKILEIGFCADIPGAFSSMEEARNSYEYHWNGCIHFFEDVREQCPTQLNAWAESRRQSMVQTLQDWATAFDFFLAASKGTLDTKGLQAAHVMKVRQIIGLMNLNREDLTVLEDEMIWDKHCSAFGEILSLVKSIIELGLGGDHPASPAAPEFTLDMGIVGPLGTVGYKCRHPILRREAIRLLAAVPRQEGMWNSILSAHICTRIMQIEEEGLGEISRCEDVPAWARVSGIELDFELQERRVLMRYSRQGSPHASVPNTLEEVILY